MAMTCTCIVETAEVCADFRSLPANAWARMYTDFSSNDRTQLMEKSNKAKTNEPAGEKPSIRQLTKIEKAMEAATSQKRTDGAEEPRQPSHQQKSTPESTTSNWQEGFSSSSGGLEVPLPDFPPTEAPPSLVADIDMCCDKELDQSRARIAEMKGMLSLVCDALGESMDQAKVPEEVRRKMLPLLDSAVVLSELQLTGQAAGPPGQSAWQEAFAEAWQARSLAGESAGVPPPAQEPSRVPAVGALSLVEELVFDYVSASVIGAGQRIAVVAEELAVAVKEWDEKLAGLRWWRTLADLVAGQA